MQVLIISGEHPVHKIGKVKIPSDSSCRSFAAILGLLAILLVAGAG